MVLINLVMAVLAAWRITTALHTERIGRGFRAKVAGEKHDDFTNMDTYPDTFLAALVVCFRCFSFWISIVCVFFYFFFPPFLYPFAISTLVIILNEKVLHG